MSKALATTAVEESCDAEHLDSQGSHARRQRLMAARTVEALADTFRVLGDPTRVRILDALSTGELCVCDIATLAGISESAVSHQLRLLRGMRLVRPRRSGRQVFYSVDDHHILELLKQALTHVEENDPPSSGRIPTRSGGQGAMTETGSTSAEPERTSAERRAPSADRR